jgi:hypothetical protein
MRVALGHHASDFVVIVIVVAHRGGVNARVSNVPPRVLSRDGVFHEPANSGYHLYCPIKTLLLMSALLQSRAPPPTGTPLVILEIVRPSTLV